MPEENKQASFLRDVASHARDNSVNGAAVVSGGKYFATANDLAAALGRVKCLHDLSVELIAADIFEATDHVEDVRAMVVPAGYALVPIEPTDRQLFNAAFNLCTEFGDEFVRNQEKFAKAAYCALIAAAPALGGE